MSLKSELDTFYSLFKQHLNGAQKATLVWVTCTAISWEEGTMTATDDEGLEYFDVMLGVGSMLVKPALNTDCLIGVVHGHSEMAFLISADEVEQIIFNGGSNGGLANVATINQNLESLKNFVEAIHTALPAAFSAIGAGTAANGATGGTSYSTAMAGKTVVIKDMENKKIEH